MFPLYHMQTQVSLRELASLNKQFWQGWPCDPSLKVAHGLYGKEKGGTGIILPIYFPVQSDTQNAPLRS